MASRKSLMMGADITRAVLVCLVPVGSSLGFIPLAGIYAVVFLVSLLNLLFGTAQTAFMPRLVGREELPTANAVLGLARQLAMMAGPALGGGGLVTALPDPAAALYATAGTLLWSALMVSTLPTDPRPHPTLPGFGSVWTKMAEGMAHVLARRPMVTLALTAAASNVMAGPIEHVFAVLARTTLPGGATTFGLLNTALGAGMVAGSALARFIMKQMGHVDVVYGGIAVFAAGLAFVALARNVPAAVAAVLLLGFAMSPVNIAVLTWMQQTTGDNTRGRVIAIFNGLSQLVAPLAMGGAGHFLEVAGPAPVLWTLAMFGGGLFILGVAVLRPVLTVAHDSVQA